MAKKKEKEVGTPLPTDEYKDEYPKEVEKEAVAEAKKGALFPLFKYFQLKVTTLHPYTRAYLEEQYRGAKKTMDEWDKEMKQYMEGK